MSILRDNYDLLMLGMENALQAREKHGENMLSQRRAALRSFALWKAVDAVCTSKANKRTLHALRKPQTSLWQHESLELTLSWLCAPLSLP